MTEADVTRCPVCGAPVAARAERCDFCASPLSTVRCSACFTLNSNDALHCSGCGHELGLEPLAAGKIAVACPGCGQAFSGYSAPSGLLVECDGCGGQFVEHALLRDLIERREVHRAVTRALPRPENPLKKPVVYLKCPHCRTLMNRNNFGGSSGIVVDVCSRHGVWFDAGELPRVLGFVQAGGLERERTRKREQERALVREKRLESPRLPASSEARELEWTTHFAEALLELLTTIGTPKS